MNIYKHIEALFLGAALAGLVVSFVTAAERPVEVAASTTPVIEATQVHVVVVKAARLVAR